MKIVFIKTPRYLWPFNSEASAFLAASGLPVSRRATRNLAPDWSVRILDCPGSRIGWVTLSTMLGADWPDVLCLGEETVSSHEAMRLARLVKQHHPRTVVIAGGVFFSHAARNPLDPA